MPGWLCQLAARRYSSWACLVRPRPPTSGARDRLGELLTSPHIRTAPQLIALLALVMAPLSGLIPTLVGGLLFVMQS